MPPFAKYITFNTNYDYFKNVLRARRTADRLAYLIYLPGLLSGKLKNNHLTI